MDCNHARFLLNFVRPGRADLDAADHSALEAHLQACSECGTVARAEAEADQVIANSMTAVAVPQSLRERVLDQLSNKDPLRNRRRWVKGLTSAAAILLIGVVAWFVWQPLPRFNFDDYVPVEVAGPADIERWFSDKGVDMAAPRQLNYQLLKSFDTALFQGRAVPRLLFARGSAGGRVDIAEVFVLSDRQFDLENLPESGPSGRNMRIEHPDKPGFAFLILFSGDSLDPFRAAGEVAQ